MVTARLAKLAWLAAGPVCLLPPLLADTYPLILQGKVTMSDGSLPPKGVSIERFCSDVQGSEPGPLANGKGEYLWRIEVDPLLTRVCVLRAHLNGYTSSEIDISGLNSYSNTKFAPLVLTPNSGDPTVIRESETGVPAKAEASWHAAMKAVDAGDMAEATVKLQAAVAAVPKFGAGWGALGLIYGTQAKSAQARDAFEHAIATDPKFLAPYVNLARLCVQTEDWNCAARAVDGFFKVDLKHQYPEMYLHQAVARLQLKDVAGAETSVQQSLRLDRSRQGARAEYVLGRILLTKGDTAGAREHIAKYLELDPKTKDADQIRAELQNLDGTAAPQPVLELP